MSLRLHARLAVPLVLASAARAGAQPDAPPEGAEGAAPAEEGLQPAPAEEPSPDPAPAPAPAPEPAPAPAAAPAPAPAPAPPAPAAAETSTLLAPVISGFVDVTYNYNLSDPAGGITPFHSYTAPHNSFLLNAAHLALSGEGEQLRYAVEVDLGTDAAVNSGDDDVDLQEAYVSYVSSSGVGFLVGKFVTFSGIEVIESGSNPTISRGFLFGLAEAFTHVGAVATYQVSPSLDLALGVINGWDLVVDNNDAKMLVAKLGYSTDGASVTVSGYAGPDQAGDEDNWRLSGDVTGMVALGAVELWGQVNAGSEEGTALDGDTGRWIGFGLQPVWRASSRFSLGGRAELFSDGDGARTGVDQTLFNLTVTPAFLVAPGLVVRGEVRVDVSNEDVFVDEDADASGTQVVALAEAIYSF